MDDMYKTKITHVSRDGFTIEGWSAWEPTISLEELLKIAEKYGTKDVSVSITSFPGIWEDGSDIEYLVEIRVSNPTKNTEDL